ncbi:helix-turn-helix transcriptional regulator [Burkholderia sp. 3C]
MAKNQVQDAALRQSLPAHQPTPINMAEMPRRFGSVMRILRMKQLIECTNLSRATLYVLMSSDPTFPKKIKLTARSIGFLESEVDAWIAARAELRNVA